MTYTNLVHNSDPRILNLLFKLKHSWRDITRGNNILLVSNGRLDDGRVKGIWDQANDKIMFCYRRVEGFFV